MLANLRFASADAFHLNCCIPDSPSLDATATHSRLELLHLGTWHRLIAMVGPTMRERGSEWLGQTPARHRARDDAEQLLRALAYAAEIESINVQDFIR